METMIGGNREECKQEGREVRGETESKAGALRGESYEREEGEE